MKRILFIIALVVSMSATVEAQYSTSQQPLVFNGTTAIVEAKVFPLGALVTYETNYDSLHKAFINMFAHFWAKTETNLPEGAFADSLLGVHGGDLLEEYHRYKEQRNYLFSGYRRADEQQYDYAVTNGNFLHKAGAMGGTDDLEWLIGATDTIPKIAEDTTTANPGYNGQYLLRTPTNQLNGNPGTEPKHFATYFDFMYSFDQGLSEYIALDSLDEIFTLELWIKGAKGESAYSATWNKWDTVLYFTITKKIFEDALNEINSHKWVTELEHNLSTAPLSSGGNGRPYARFHIALDSTFMRHFYLDGKTGATGFLLQSNYTSPSISSDDRDKVRFDFRLRRNPAKPIPIFVKGLRMRNGGAEKLLTGQLDDQLLDQFTKISQSKYMVNGVLTQGNDFYKNIINIHLEGEPYPDRYYIMAYVDRFARDNSDPTGKSFKRITSFTPYRLKQSRLIWDDILWKSGDHTLAPEHLYRNIDYVTVHEARNRHWGHPYDTFPHPMAALPLDVLPKSAIAGDTLKPSVLMFTQRVTKRTDSAVRAFDLEHDSIFARSFRNSLREVNQAAFSLGSKRIPFWIMGQAYIGYFWMQDFGVVDSFHWDQQNHPRPHLTLSEIKAWLVPLMQQLHNTPGASSGAFYDSVFDGSKFYEVSEVGYDRGHLGAEQIRLQANVAAAWGAQGFTLSNAGTDAANIGFTTTNVLKDEHGRHFEHDAEMPTEGVALSNLWVNLGDDTAMRYLAFDTCLDITVFDNDTTPSSNCIVYDRNTCMNGGIFRTLPFVAGGPSIYNSCNQSHFFYTRFNTFYGFKTRYRGAQWAFGDLNYAAEKLKGLTWEAAVDISGRDQSANDTSLIPIKNIESVIQERQRVSSIGTPNYIDSLAESGDDRLVEVGAFTDSTDPNARYIYVVNRRVWPNRDSDDTALTDNNYLGNVAVRNIRFQVRPQLFGADSSFLLWSVTDWTKKHDSTIHRDSLYGVLLEPGEGRLFRVAPAIGLRLGRMDNNLFNNGRHICAVENDTGGASTAVSRYLATYTRDSMVVVSFPVETPEGLSRRNTDTPVDSIIDSSRKNFNPAIAYNYKKNAIGVVYQNITRDTTPSSLTDTIRILYRRASNATPYAFSSAKEIDKFTVQRPYTAPPAIASRTNNGSGQGEFWISYNHPDSGARICLINSLGVDQFGGKRNYFKTLQAHVELVSIATHIPSDTVHIAFQEGTNTERHIYYAQGYIVNGTTLTVTPSASIQQISNHLTGCGGQERHPQITVTEDRTVGVIWETQGTRCLNPPNIPACALKLKWQNVLTRHRNPNAVWRNYTLYRIQADTVYTDEEDSLYEFFFAYPNIAQRSGEIPDFPTAIWIDWERIMWNHPKEEKVHIWRFGNQSEDDLPGWRNRYIMVAPSVEPAMPTMSQSHMINTPLLYRDPNFTNDNACITRFDFPYTPIVRRGIDVASIRPLSGVACAEGPTGKLGQVIKQNEESTRIVLLPMYDSLTDPSPNLDWEDNRVRTEGFNFAYGDTLRYQRYFYVGNYEEGDTAAAASGLTDTNDHITLRIYMKAADNDSVIAVLDTARLFQNGFVQTAGFLSAWRVHYAPLGFSDSVYLSMEAYRGDPANSFELAHFESYDDDIFDSIPSTPPMFKKGENPSPLPSASSSTRSTPLAVTVNPNPFSGSTTITVETLKGLPFLIEVYDLLGKRLGTVYNGISEQEKGWFTVGREMLTPGSYFVRVQAGSQVVTRKIELVK